MQIPLYQVDAFTSELFGGNPAAVCPLPEWLPDETLQAIAVENNLSETAFYMPAEDGYHLRWFTPEIEVDLCGHATLATAHVILNCLGSDADHVRFDSRGGELIVRRDGDRLSMDFPSHPPKPYDPPEGLLEALGGEPLEALRGIYTLVVYGSEQEVRGLSPDIAGLATAGDDVIVTAPGDDSDFVSRFFAPMCGIPEDPVTGSAHCTLIPFWSLRKCKSVFMARQVSARGGVLFCEDRGERVTIAGQAVLYMKGAIEI